MPRRLTPAEKKRLSYERDRRNAYGENDKGSRKAIPRRKRLRARAERRRAAQGLEPGTVPARIEEGDHLDVELLPDRGPSHWRKMPDKPLARHVAIRLNRRRAR